MKKALILGLTLLALHPGWPALARAETATSEGLQAPRQFSAYEPTYILPAYYTFSPDDAVYGNTLPNGQNLNKLEVKFQLSFKIAMASSGLAKYAYVAYTQLSYWQLYRDSAFFRETDYQPELLIEPDKRWHLGDGWDIGWRVSPFVHQSNGRGGNLERSWDRTSAGLLFEHLDRDGDGWTVDLRAWGVWRDPAYDRYNPDLAHYLGYLRPSVAYKRGEWELSLVEHNQLESGFRRGSVEASVSHYFGSNWSLYAQYFNGYGQSLIEYDHATNAVGVGFALRTR
jgi:phospholipase A1